ncbi:Peptidase M48, Ste24p [Richelia intracellularis]|nr:Peptidase M48, Ste24p [Richelia intracellularis]
MSLSNVTQYLPLGGTVERLFTLSYSRDMERQADSLGTRLIVSTGYAADGLRNLMVSMDKEQKNAPPSPMVIISPCWWARSTLFGRFNYPQRLQSLCL